MLETAGQREVVEWREVQLESESDTGEGSLCKRLEATAYAASAVTVTEGVEQDTYGRCQCRSGRQTDRRAL